MRVCLHEYVALFDMYSDVCLQVAHFKDYIPKAFPTSSDLILDAEVLLVDTATGNPLPFGTLGVHKVSASLQGVWCLVAALCSPWGLLFYYYFYISLYWCNLLIHVSMII